MQETIVTNMPTAPLWIMAGALVVFAFSTLLIAVAALTVLGSLKKLLDEATKATAEVRGGLPQLMNSWRR